MTSPLMIDKAANAAKAYLERIGLKPEWVPSTDIGVPVLFTMDGDIRIFVYVQSPDIPTISVSALTHWLLMGDHEHDRIDLLDIKPLSDHSALLRHHRDHEDMVAQ
ncbi:MAG: hypothetical protein RQ731_08050 [Anaerosomatales bacterium]|nr:hypothetical protein [Anaerosomatales bacterium]